MISCVADSHIFSFYQDILVEGLVLKMRKWIPTTLQHCVHALKRYTMLHFTLLKALNACMDEFNHGNNFIHSKKKPMFRRGHCRVT